MGYIRKSYWPFYQHRDQFRVWKRNRIGSQEAWVNPELATSLRSDVEERDTAPQASVSSWQHEGKGLSGSLKPVIPLLHGGCLESYCFSEGSQFTGCKNNSQTCMYIRTNQVKLLK